MLPPNYRKLGRPEIFHRARAYSIDLTLLPEDVFWCIVDCMQNLPRLWLVCNSMRNYLQPHIHDLLPLRHAMLGMLNEVHWLPFFRIAWRDFRPRHRMLLRLVFCDVRLRIVGEQHDHYVHSTLTILWAGVVEFVHARLYDGLRELLAAVQSRQSVLSRILDGVRYTACFFGDVRALEICTEFQSGPVVFLNLAPWIDNSVGNPIRNGEEWRQLMPQLLACDFTSSDFHHAVRSDKLPCMRLLISQCACQLALTKEATRALSFVRSFEVLQLLVQNGAELEGRNVLTSAAVRGHADSLGLLIDARRAAGVLHLSSPTDSLHPLVWAARSGNPAACRALVEASGTEDYIWPVTFGSAIHHAYIYGHVTCVRYLVTALPKGTLTTAILVDALALALVEMKDEAVRWRRAECVGAILEADAAVGHDVRIIEAHVLLHKTRGRVTRGRVTRGRVDRSYLYMLQAFLATGMSPDTENADGDSLLGALPYDYDAMGVPMHYETIYAAVLALLEAGADVHHHSVVRLHLQHGRDMDVLQLLADAGAADALFSVQGASYAARNTDEHFLVAYLRRLPDVLDWARHEARVLLYARDATGNTLLHHLAADGENDQIDNLHVLLQEGAQLESRNDDGDTPLAMAVYCGRMHTAMQLVSKGADADATNNFGDTPLRMAYVFRHSSEFIERLLAATGRALEADGQLPTLFPKGDCLVRGLPVLASRERTSNFLEALLLHRHGYCADMDGDAWRKLTYQITIAGYRLKDHLDMWHEHFVEDQPRRQAAAHWGLGYAMVDAASRRAHFVPPPAWSTRGYCLLCQFNTDIRQSGKSHVTALCIRGTTRGGLLTLAEAHEHLRDWGIRVDEC
jgi:ankyrin repeat protein